MSLSAPVSATRHVANGYTMTVDYHKGIMALDHDETPDMTVIGPLLDPDPTALVDGPIRGRSTLGRPALPAPKQLRACYCDYTYHPNGC
jgi:hypothetical protein